MSGLLGLTATGAVAWRSPSKPSLDGARAQNGSMPEIRIGEATLGRESLAAIERELGTMLSLPEIHVGEAALRPVSLAAIEHEDRDTQPWAGEVADAESVSNLRDAEAGDA